MTRRSRDLTTGLIDRFWTALPYALLAITVAISLAERPRPPELLWMVALAAFIAAWHWWWAIRHRLWLGTRLLPMGVYFLGLLASTAILCLLSFTYFPLYLMCFAIAFVALPRGWAYLGIAVTAVVAFAVPWLLAPTFDNVAAIVGGGALAAAAGWSIRALERSQAHLRHALDANRALQDQLVMDAHDAGAAAERARLAAEFHDTIAAGLTGVISQLEALDAQLEPANPLHDRVYTAAEVAREALGEARRSVTALRPAALSGRSLPGALSIVTSGFERSRRIPVVLHVTGEEVDLPEAVEHGLLRAGQEALTNIAQHAEATHVHVTLSYLEDTIALDVTDDGIGLQAPRQRPGGQGLRIMRERIEHLGGHAAIDGGAGQGTTITVSVPLHSDGHSGENSDGYADG